MYLIIILPLIYIHFFLLRNSIFGINIKSGNYLGLFFILPFIIYMVPCISILYFFPASDFTSAFKVDQSLVSITSTSVLLSYIILISTTYLIFKIFPIFKFSDNYLKLRNNVRLVNILNASIAIILILIFVLYFFYGIEHSLILASSDYYDLSQARSVIANDKFLRYISQLIVSYCYISAIVLGLVKNFINLKFPFLYILFISFLSLWGGAKSPAIIVMILYFITVVSTINENFKFNVLIFRSFFAFFIVLTTIYLLVLKQGVLVDNYNIFDYIINRIFIGQMIGVYEQFSLNISDFNYFYHSIPFVNFFIDSPNFHKDLMMITEDRIDPDNIGIKNSYFLAEAISWGLFFEVIWAPIIWSFGYAFTIFIFSRFIQISFMIGSGASIFISMLFISSQINVTSGMSDVVVLKFLVFQLLLFLPLVLFFKFLMFRKYLSV